MTYMRRSAEGAPVLDGEPVDGVGHRYDQPGSPLQRVGLAQLAPCLVIQAGAS